MLSKVNLAWIGALTILPHLAVAAGADSLPTASIEGICRDAQSAALPESKAAAYRACVHDERAAYDELRKKWPRYSAKSRVTCAEPGDGAAISYVELQTCLDMQPGGSLTTQGRAPGAAPAVDTMAYPSPVAPALGQKE